MPLIIDHLFSQSASIISAVLLFESHANLLIKESLGYLCAKH